MGSQFPNHLRRLLPRQVFLVAIDSKPGMVNLKCPSCGHMEGWVSGLTSTEARRQPCPKCNGVNPR